MRTLSCCLLLAAACAAPPHVERAPLVPPLAVTQPSADLERDIGVRAAADRSPGRPMSELPSRYTPPPADETTVAYRSVVEVVQVPQANTGGDAGYDQQARGYYDDWQPQPQSYQYQDRRRGWFPVNTAVGAGIGAVIGHQSGRRDRGALIGGGLGLFLDMQRWWR